MATATVSLAVQDVDETRRNRVRVIKMTVTASPDTYKSGGLTLDLTAVTNPNNLPCASFGRNPTGFAVLEAFPGYSLHLIPGATLATWKVQIFEDSGANAAFAELADNSAIPAAISGSVNNRISFTAPKNL